MRKYFWELQSLLGQVVRRNNPQIRRWICHYFLNLHWRFWFSNQFAFHQVLDSQLAKNLAHGEMRQWHRACTHKRDGVGTQPGSHRGSLRQKRKPKKGVVKSATPSYPDPLLPLRRPTLPLRLQGRLPVETAEESHQDCPEPVFTTAFLVMMGQGKLSFLFTKHNIFI